jgi:hypothetical protein
MKKIIALSITMLLTISTYGQTSGVYHIIANRYPDHITLEKDVMRFGGVDNIKAYLTDRNTAKYAEIFEKKAYSFVENGKLYVVSYDTIRKTIDDCFNDGGINNCAEHLERDVHLFCWDNGKWSIATDEPIQTDYEKRVKDVRILENYYPMFYPDWNAPEPEYGQKVEKLDGGIVKITLVSHKHTGEDIYSKFYQKIIFLIPNGDGTYHPTWNGKKIPLEFNKTYAY